MKNSTFALKVKSLLSNVYDTLYPEDDTMPELSKKRMLGLLKMFLEPAAANHEILRMCRAFLSSEDGQKVFGTDELTEARVSAKLSVCIIAYIKKTLESQSRQPVANAKRSYGPRPYEFPIVPEDYLLKEVPSPKISKYEFAALWEVKHHDRTIGTIAFSVIKGQSGYASYLHHATNFEGGKGTLQSALNCLMDEDDKWIRNTIAFTKPKGFRVQRVNSESHKYLISRRGHLIGEITYLSGDGRDHKGDRAGYMWQCYRSDACDDGVLEAQDAVDLVIESHLTSSKGKK